MPKLLRPILLALILAASAALYGCGDSGPDPSITPDEAAVLSAKIDEIKSNVDVGSCLVAADRTNDLIADIQNLPSSVDRDVKQALSNGANNLKILLNDPEKCQSRSETTTSETTTSTPTETTESTTQRTEPTTTTRTQTQQTTTTQTQTTPTQTTPGGGASGGIGPGGL